MKTANPRAAMLAKAHLLAKQLGLEGESYRTYLLCITGKRSCRECDEQELQRVIAALQQLISGGDPDQVQARLPTTRRLPAGAIPTLRQWETLVGLAASMGWSGLEDPRLLAFAQRTAHVNSIHELSRTQISACITGLLNWQTQLKAKGIRNDR